MLHAKSYNTSSGKTPRRRGRTARKEEESAGDYVAVQRRRIPVFDLLGEAALRAIETQADWILENVGVDFITIFFGQ